MLTRSAVMKASLALRERTADTIVHVIGIVAGLFAVTVMMVAAVSHLPHASTASLAIYGAGMLAMLA